MPSSSIDLIVLRRRAEFLAVAAYGKKWITTAFVLQTMPSPVSLVGDNAVRYGLTASGKIGNAVKRNRARRRLRAVMQAVLPEQARPRQDFVIIARAAALTRDFVLLKQDLVWALKKLNGTMAGEAVKGNTKQ